MQIIKFTDVNVDGFGTNVEVYIQVEGTELTNGIIERTKAEIEKYKEENYYGEWDTDSVIDVACEYLRTEGYVCHAVIPHYEIEF